MLREIDSIGWGGGVNGTPGGRLEAIGYRLQAAAADGN
jgi:hypothetical protein